MSRVASVKCESLVWQPSTNIWQINSLSLSTFVNLATHLRLAARANLPQSQRT